MNRTTTPYSAFDTENTYTPTFSTPQDTLVMEETLRKRREINSIISRAKISKRLASPAKKEPINWGGVLGNVLLVLGGASAIYLALGMEGTAKHLVGFMGACLVISGVFARKSNTSEIPS